MKPSKWVFTVLLSLGLSLAALADPGVDAPPDKRPLKLSFSVVTQNDGSVVDRLDMSSLSGPGRDKRIPSTPGEWLERMIDPTRNGLILKQPHLFAEWLDAVTEPQFMTALATVALDPGTYPKALSRLADPATARNWAEFVDPDVLMRWMAAGMDPRLYQSVFQHMFDPKKYLRWANAQVGAPESRKLAERERWMQIPVQEPRENPWLANSRSYRY
jgi:hypothetical protein